MKITAILKDFTQEFYIGGRGIHGINNMTDVARFDYFKKMALDKSLTLKIGNGSFRDAVDLNHMLKSGATQWSYKLEDRRGYKLATFNIVAA
jgi:hypothetical protein